MERRKVNAIVAGLLLASPAALRAEHDEPGAASSAEVHALADAGGNTPAVRISAGRAADLVGAPRYPDRLKVSTDAMLVNFASAPVVRRLERSGNLAGNAPLAGARMSSAFGLRRHPVTGAWTMHSGVDLAAPLGTPVVAAQAGTVRSADWKGAYGLLVVLEHEGGGETRYAHLSRVAVRPGQSIAAGETLGFVGATGNATGPHLHFERRSGGRAYNPVAN